MTNKDLNIEYLDVDDLCPTGKCYIYVLVDPISGDIRYVGKTKCSLSSRLYYHKRTILPVSKVRHYCRNWIKSLASVGSSPVIRAVQVVNAHEWEDAERTWISNLKKNGADLTNISLGGSGYTGIIHREWSKNKKENMSALSRVRNKTKFLVFPSGEIVMGPSNLIDIEEYTGVKARYLSNSFLKKTMVLKRYFIVNDPLNLPSNKFRECEYSLTNMNTNVKKIFSSREKLLLHLSISSATLWRLLNSKKSIEGYKIEKHYEALR